MSALLLAALIALSACGRGRGCEGCDSSCETCDSSCESCESGAASCESCGSCDSSCRDSRSGEASCESCESCESGGGYESSGCASCPEDGALSADTAFAHSFGGTVYEGRSEIRLVALGDSIARGFLLDEPEKQAYPALICEGLRKGLDGTAVAYANYAVDGSETADLLELLQSGAPELEDADIVTLCIGANNVLHPFMDCLTQLSVVLARGFGGSAGEASGEASGEAVASGEASGSAEAVGELFDRVNAFLESAEFSDSMSAGLRSAKADLGRILARIGERAPDARVLVMNVYSPYHGMNFTLPYIGRSLKLGDLSDRWVSELNAVIAEEAESAGCELVDVCGAFRKRRGLVNAGIGLLPPRFSADPHPNLSGHTAIADLHLSVLARPARQAGLS